MELKFYRKVLKNGMTVLLEKRDLPIVSVAFAVKSGGVNEEEGEKGISHFIEHMLYKGTPTRNSKEIADEIEKKGGELNGFTEEIITAYWCKVPDKHINTALEVLGDMVRNPLFDEKEIEKERQVIFEEIKMHHDNPISCVFEGIKKTLYGNPVGLNIIGDYNTLSKMNKKILTSKFNQVYQPNNFILAAVGNTDFNKLVRYVEKNFGKTRGKIQRFKPKIKNEIKLEKRKGIDQANLVFAFHIPLFGGKKSYAAKILITLMARGLSSRLFHELREKRNLVYSIGGDSIINKDFAYNFIYSGTTKKNLETVKSLIIEEFKKVSRNLDEKELKQTKEQIIGNHRISMEDSQMQLANLLFFEVNGNARKFYDFEDDIKKVKLKDVKEISNIKKYSFFALVPED
ncbi:MAG: pitrilysin family protein [Nanoarchaeota archaeon]